MQRSASSLGLSRLPGRGPMAARETRMGVPLSKALLIPRGSVKEAPTTRRPGLNQSYTVGSSMDKWEWNTAEEEDRELRKTHYEEEDREWTKRSRWTTAEDDDEEKDQGLRELEEMGEREGS